jgi:hypothetical protein
MIIVNAAAQLTALAAIIIQAKYSIAVAKLLGLDDFWH